MRARARDESGFGLVELMIALTILNIGIFAILASFNSGIVTLQRAGRIATAATLADAQMELYRAIKYDAIRLDPATIPSTAPYTGVFGGAQVTTPACTVAGDQPYECNASRVATGADNRPYRIDTYIVHETPPSGRELKKVTVVVRDAENVSRIFARETTAFDRSTGN